MNNAKANANANHSYLPPKQQQQQSSSSKPSLASSSLPSSATQTNNKNLSSSSTRTKTTSGPRTVRYQLDTNNLHHSHRHQQLHQHTYQQQQQHNQYKNQHNQVSVPAYLYDILSSLTKFICIVLCAIGLTTTLSILYLTIRPFSVPTYRRLACNIGASAMLDAMALLLPNTRIYLTGDSDPLSPVGVSVLVCNHVMEGDWWSVLMLARCVGLRGSVKPFLQSNTSSAACTTSSSGNNGGSSTPPYLSTMTEQDIRNASPSSSPPLPASISASKSTSTSTSTYVSASVPLLNQQQVQHGFKRNLSHQGVQTTINTNTNAINTAPTTTTTTTGNHSPDQNISTNSSNFNQNTAASPTKDFSSTPSSSTTTATATTTTTSRISHIWSFFHNLLDFPILSSEHTQNYITDRNELFSLLRSFASNGAPAPIHLLLFPEGWTDGINRKSMMNKSIEFAKREGRPQLQHLLLPRTTGFYASLDSLREAAPVIYDITMAYRGYDGGERPFSCDISLGTIMKLIRGEVPNEVYIRIKRYSMDEVLSDAQWLDKQWAEKDRLLGKFVRSGNFNVDNRGFCRYRIMDTRFQNLESSITALFRLGLIPFAIPVILILFIPLLWGVAWVWIAHRSFLMFFPGGMTEVLGSTHMGDGYNRYGRGVSTNKEEVNSNPDDISNGGTDSAAGTPFFPATPFASPTHVASWRSAAPTSSTKDSDSPPNGRREMNRNI